MAPLPPKMLTLLDAAKLTAKVFDINAGVAFDRLLDALCDCALFAYGRLRDGSTPTWRTIPAADWQMHKYDGVGLNFDNIEIGTAYLLQWFDLSAAERQALAEKIANVSQKKKSDVPVDSLPLDETTQAPTAITLKSGLVGRPTSMHLILDEAKRRTADSEYKMPTTKAEFVRQLVEWLKTDYPGAAPAQCKTAGNNSELKRIYSERMLKKMPEIMPKIK